MENRINGLHHVTAIAGSVQGNYDFYAKAIGQRFVKKTVNFDDPAPIIFIMAMKWAHQVPFLPFSHGRELEEARQARE